ncbi:MAG: hypothetical protein ACRCT7_12230, partial [Shewanella sp.]
PPTAQLARYLLDEPNAQCRQGLWTAYHLRAQGRNQQALEALQAIRKQQANLQKHDNFNDLQLYGTHLASQTERQQFISGLVNSAQVSRTLTVAPWSLYQALAKQPKTALSAMSSDILLNAWRQKLQTLGFDIETSEHGWAIRYQRQLLGILKLYHNDDQPEPTPPKLHAPAQLHIISLAARPSAHAQVVLSYPSSVNSLSQVSQLLGQLAKAIVTISASSQFSLNNHNELIGDSDLLAKEWLIQLLQPVADTWFRAGARDTTLTRYQAHWQLFQAAAALKFYGDDINLASLFTDLFGEPWPNADIAYYGFSSITTGAHQLSQLWAQTMSQQLYQASQDCRQQADMAITQLLVINPQHLPLTTRLAPLLPAASLGNFAIGSSYHVNYAHSSAHPKRTLSLCSKL